MYFFLTKKSFGIYRDLKCYFHEAPHIVAQLYGVPRGILEAFNAILYENEFQNPQIFHQRVR
jgi:hypothetical protein